MAGAESEPGSADLMPVRKAARLAGVSHETVYTWIRQGLVSPAGSSRGGLLVSAAAIRAEADARRAGAWAAYVPPGARELPDGDDDAGECMLPWVAARAVGLPAFRMHAWIRQGKVPYRPSHHGRLVRLLDAQAVAGHVQVLRPPAGQRAADVGD
jgi:predicted site-specific integrase-resolvase